MKKISRYILPLILCILPIILILVTQKEKAESQMPNLVTYSASSEDELRGIWVASVINLDYPSSPTTSAEELRNQIDIILNNIEAWGFNAVFLQVRPCSDALYESEIYPWSAYLTGSQGMAPSSGFDPLDYWVAESHKRNLELHAWINPFRITHDLSEWENLSAESPAKLHTEWTVKYNDNFYFDPALPQVRQLIIDGAVELVENYDVDGIHMDDHFYPGTDFDDASSYAVYGADFMDIGDWRRNNINLLIQNMSKSLHDSNPDVVFGIAPAGIWASKSQNPAGSDTTNSYSSYYNLYADTKHWVESGWLDYIAPQLYWEIGHETSDFTTLLHWWADVVAAAENDTKLYIGLADYLTAEAASSKDPWYNGAEIIRQINACNAAPEVEGMIHFRYQFIAESSVLQQILSQAYCDALSQ